MKAHTVNVLSRQRGFTLMEMMVALLILSFGLLGIAGMQALSLRNNNNAYFRTQANIFAYDIVDRMRANRTAAVAGSYDIALGASATGSSVAKVDLAEWKSILASTLNSGDGAVNCNAAGLCAITVQWFEVAADGGTLQFLLSTEI